jgi:hypothetical protein
MDYGVNSYLSIIGGDESLRKLRPLSIHESERSPICDNELGEYEGLPPSESEVTYGRNDLQFPPTFMYFRGGDTSEINDFNDFTTSFTEAYYGSKDSPLVRYYGGSPDKLQRILSRNWALVYLRKPECPHCDKFDKEIEGIAREFESLERDIDEHSRIQFFKMDNRDDYKSELERIINADKTYIETKCTQEPEVVGGRESGGAIKCTRRPTTFTFAGRTYPLILFFARTKLVGVFSGERTLDNLLKFVGKK